MIKTPVSNHQVYKKKPAKKANNSSNQSVRSVAATVLSGVIKGGSLTRLLSDYSPRVALNDRALLSELTFGSCRWFVRLQAALSLLMKKPLRKRDSDVHALLILGLYQLIYMRIKPHAILAETVDASRKMGKPMFTKLVNGVLRSFQREQETILKQVDQSLSHEMSMPQWLLDELKLSWPDRWRDLMKALLEQAPMTLRLNIQRCPQHEYLARLEQENIQVEAIEGIESALILSSPLSVSDIPGFDDGLISVQDGGAQLAAEFLDAKANSSVLDSCAAPGGKTGHILERAESIELIALDIDGDRLNKVEDNLKRLKLTAELNIGDAANPGGDWSTRTYDYILLDVPCSATGVIRRHPDIKLLRRKGDIDELVKLQRSILTNIWSLLNKNGRLLYATCSLLKQENENQIDWFLQQQSDAAELLIETEVEHQRRQHGIQVLPGKSKMDGFFYSLLTKNNDGT